MTSDKKLLTLAVAAASLGMAGQLSAQEQSESNEQSGQSQIEEVVVFSRLRTAAEDVLMERIESDAATDLLTSEMIGRIGDSTVAKALRRVPGVTLVDDKFIYVRGLGERYSSTLLNKAVVPSPDLTRSVLPLDIFPTSIIDTLSVQKTYTADMPASFGGGNVNIRTKGIPEEFVFNAEIGTNYNADTSGSGLTYNGGDDDWMGKDDGTREFPDAIAGAFQQYQGDISTLNILNFLRRQDGSATLAQAQEINQGLAQSLYRDISIDDEDVGENISGEVNIGNRFYFDNGIEFGFLAGAAYDQEFETQEITTRRFNDPQELVAVETESTRSIDITGNLALGLRLNGEQEINTTSLFLRNTDDEVAIENFHNTNRTVSSGLGFRDYDIRWEEREMTVNQIKGSHVWGPETRETLGLEWVDEKLPFLDQLQFDWYFSDSEATTDIPSETTVRAQTITVPGTTDVVSSRLQLSDSMANYRFTDLEDDVESEGWQLKWPYSAGNFEMELSGGWDYVQKTRTYRQTDLRLGSTDPDALAILGQDLGQVFSDDNIANDDFSFSLDNARASSRSYIAATTNESVFLQADVTWRDQWRLIAGGRYEEYIQVGLPWNPLVFNTDGTVGQIPMDVDELRDAVFTDDDIYPAASLIYMRDGFLAETYQLRFAYSETVVRPDLREIADTSYLDPLTDALVFGNPDVVPSNVTNYDIRSEWFFANGDNLTLSLFYKEIEDPIEFFERAATDTKVASEVINAESAEMLGVEVEWLKDLAFIGDRFSPFFVAGNITWLDHELTVGNRADSPTNLKREVAGASDHVVNLLLGFDSNNGKHAATLAYNVFGERLYTAGRLGAPDSFEQPFHSLDFTYSFYPTDRIIVKAKLQNLLDEERTIERDGTEIYTEEVGLQASLALKWQF